MAAVYHTGVPGRHTSPHVGTKWLRGSFSPCAHGFSSVTFGRFLTTRHPRVPWWACRRLHVGSRVSHRCDRVSHVATRVHKVALSQSPWDRLRQHEISEFRLDTRGWPGGLAGGCPVAAVYHTGVPGRHTSPHVCTKWLRGSFSPCAHGFSSVTFGRFLTTRHPRVPWWACRRLHVGSRVSHRCDRVSHVATRVHKVALSQSPWDRLRQHEISEFRLDTRGWPGGLAGGCPVAAVYHTGVPGRHTSPHVCTKWLRGSFSPCAHGFSSVTFGRFLTTRHPRVPWWACRRLHVGSRVSHRCDRVSHVATRVHKVALSQSPWDRLRQHEISEFRLDTRGWPGGLAGGCPVAAVYHTGVPGRHTSPHVCTKWLRGSFSPCAHGFSSVTFGRFLTTRHPRVPWWACRRLHVGSRVSHRCDRVSHVATRVHKVALSQSPWDRLRQHEISEFRLDTRGWPGGLAGGCPVAAVYHTGVPGRHTSPHVCTKWLRGSFSPCAHGFSSVTFGRFLTTRHPRVPWWACRRLHVGSRVSHRCDRVSHVATRVHKVALSQSPWDRLRQHEISEFRLDTRGWPGGLAGGCPVAAVYHTGVPGRHTSPHVCTKWLRGSFSPCAHGFSSVTFGRFLTTRHPRVPWWACRRLHVGSRVSHRCDRVSHVATRVHKVALSQSPWDRLRQHEISEFRLDTRGWPGGLAGGCPVAAVYHTGVPGRHTSPHVCTKWLRGSFSPCAHGFSSVTFGRFLTTRHPRVPWWACRRLHVGSRVSHRCDRVSHVATRVHKVALSQSPWDRLRQHEISEFRLDTRGWPGGLAGGCPVAAVYHTGVPGRHTSPHVCTKWLRGSFSPCAHGFSSVTFGRFLTTRHPRVPWWACRRLHVGSRVSHRCDRVSHVATRVHKVALSQSPQSPGIG